MEAKARRLNPVAIIIDTVFRCFGEGNVNASPDMNVYLAAIAMLTDQGYAALAPPRDQAGRRWSRSRRNSDQSVCGVTRSPTICVAVAPQAFPTSRA